MGHVKSIAHEHFPGTVEVDLDAIRHNLRVLKRRAGSSELMAVVKADAYGHGRLPVALAALREGVHWFGISQVSEALVFRKQLDEAGVPRSEANVLTWLAGPEQDWQAALRSDLNVSASSPEVLRRIGEAARTLDRTAEVHLKVDVGMSRGGARGAEFAELARLARELEEDGSVRVVGVWSHLPQADDMSEVGSKVTAEQIACFEDALAAAKRAGLTPDLRHLAATSGTLWHTDSHYDMVRVGIGMYGLSPDPSVATSADLDLRPALSVKAPLVLVKQLPAGTSVSYGGTWTAEQDHWVGLVPLGYADGIPRHASNAGPVTVYGQSGPYQSHILGRVCMDQIVVSLGTGSSPAAAEGDTVALIGPELDDPTADDWALVSGTINYEIVTRLAPTIRREYQGEVGP